MPWKDTKVEDMRLDFVQAVEKYPDSFKDICITFGISRKTGYKWVKRFNENGKAGLRDLRRAPIHRPRDTNKEIIQSIINLKVRHPKWGAKKLKSIIEKKNPEINWPSVTTFGNILKRNNLTLKRRIRHRMAKTNPIEECNRPNDVWTVDFKGWWLTGDSVAHEPFTMCDCYSRYILCCRHASRKDFKSVWSLLEECFQDFGMPLRIRSDNGPPFASNSVGRLSRMAIKLIRLNITPEWITPGKPYENGAHERMHRTLKYEVASPPSKDFNSQRLEIDQFVYRYNWIRPHESLEMKTPSEVYEPSKRIWTGNEQDPDYPENYQQRKVEKSGQFKWRGIRFFISELLANQQLGLIEKEGNKVEVYFGPILLGFIDPINGFVRY